MKLEALDGFGLDGDEATESLDLGVKYLVLSLKGHVVEMYLLVEGVVLSPKAVQGSCCLSHLLLHLLLDTLFNKGKNRFIHVIKSVWSCYCRPRR